MGSARLQENHEVGMFMPVRELLDDQAKEARMLAGSLLIRLHENGQELSERPVVVTLGDGTTAVHEFTISPTVFEN